MNVALRRNISLVNQLLLRSVSRIYDRQRMSVPLPAISNRVGAGKVRANRARPGILTNLNLGGANLLLIRKTRLPRSFHTRAGAARSELICGSKVFFQIPGNQTGGRQAVHRVSSARHNRPGHPCRTQRRRNFNCFFEPGGAGSSGCVVKGERKARAREFGIRPALSAPALVRPK